MTDDRYRPRKLDDALARIAEECSEVIKIVCKAQRFGLNDHHPKKGRRNIELLAEEIEDVKTAYADFISILSMCQLPTTIRVKIHGDESYVSQVTHD